MDSPEDDIPPDVLAAHGVPPIDKKLLPLTLTVSELDINLLPTSVSGMRITDSPGRFVCADPDALLDPDLSTAFSFESHTDRMIFRTWLSANGHRWIEAIDKEYEDGLMLFTDYWHPTWTVHPAGDP